MNSTKTVFVLMVIGWGLAAGDSIFGEEKQGRNYPQHVAKYLQRIYGEDARPLAFDEEFPGGVAQWQKEAREALCKKLGLEQIAASVGEHTPVVELGEIEQLDGYTRQYGIIETEPDVRIPFWLLKPEGEGPWPLGIFPHGHDPQGHHTSAGVYSDEKHRKKSLAEDRDVAVQAVKHGLIAIAPAVRGLSVNDVPDLYRRHDGRSCRSQLMHCLVVGRTAMGERVWDMQRILDWAVKRPEVDARHVLMMGNSGGGMVTLFAAACDPRIRIAVPSCSFRSTVSEEGVVFHCDCNMVPGVLEIGGLPGVAGLIAPRYFLAVNGRSDPLYARFADDEVPRAMAQVARVYEAAGVAQRCEHRWGDGGHRFYKDRMWPFIMNALQSGKQTEKP